MQMHRQALLKTIYRLRKKVAVLAADAADDVVEAVGEDVPTIEITRLQKILSLNSQPIATPVHPVRHLPDKQPIKALTQNKTEDKRARRTTLTKLSGSQTIQTLTHRRLSLQPIVTWLLWPRPSARTIRQLIRLAQARKTPRKTGTHQQLSPSL